MPRVSFRDVVDRFTHIDGTIVRTDVSFADSEPASARVVLRFYPWWEHPLYIAARESGSDWGFDAADDGARDVVIEAVSPLRCDVRSDASAIDIAFHTEHPVLWEFEDAAAIMCNTDFDPRALVDALLARDLPYVAASTMLRYFPPHPPRTAPFALADLPFTLFHAAKFELQRMGVELFVAREPVALRPLVALDVDGNVLIVAEDFIVDVPEFEHRPQWFRLSRGAGPSTT
jgi:hypothetical protein